MAECIKRENVLKRIKGEAQFQYDQFGTVDTVIRSYATCYDIVKTEPSADVVEVVRCKDCAYYIKVKSFSKEFGYCDAIYQRLEGDLIGVTFQPDEDYFCAYGERKVSNDKT